ncbi:MAG: type II secretion system protein [bacterium]
MNFISKFNKEKGFTLTEIMVVVAIVSILVSLAIYNYTRLLTKEKVRIAARTIEIIAKAAQDYSVKHLKSGQYAEGNLSNTGAIKNQYGLEIFSENFEFSLVGSEIKAKLKKDVNGFKKDDPKYNTLTYDLAQVINNEWGGGLNQYR